MTYEQTLQISRLLQDGKGYRKIAEELDLPVNSVKSWCRRHQAEEGKTDCCPLCGRKVILLPLNTNIQSKKIFINNLQKFKPTLTLLVS